MVKAAVDKKASNDRDRSEHKAIARYKEVYHKKQFETIDRAVPLSVGKKLEKELFDGKSKEVIYKRLSGNKNIVEIIIGIIRYKYPLVKGSLKKQVGFELYSMVKREALSFIDKHNGVIDLPKECRQMSTSRNANLAKDSVKMGGYDIMHAYWRIAYNLGVISQNTYNKGFSKNYPSQYKKARLQALAVLGKPKQFEKYVNGKPAKEYHFFGGDEKLQRVYTLIRLTCYKHMDDLKHLLGENDYCMHVTDAIYFRDKKSNWLKVQQYLKENRLPHRELRKSKL